MGLLRAASNALQGSPRDMAMDSAMHSRGDVATAIAAVALAIVYVGDKIK